MRVFISYRREDDPFAVGRLRDVLAHRFGEADVFLDVLSVETGARFESVIETTIAASDVVLVMIGDRWEATNRGDSAVDYVELEVGFALAKGKRVIPVLLGQRPMPTRQALRGALLELGSINAHRVRIDPDFRSDAVELVRFIEASSAELEGGGPARARHRLGGLALLAVGSVAVIVLLAVSLVFKDHPSDQTLPSNPSAEPAATSSGSPVSVLSTTNSMVLERLADYVDSDRVVALRLSGSWVPQLSASYIGFEFGGVTYDAETILKVHEGLRSSYGAILVSGRDFQYLANGEPMTDWYFTVVPVAHATRAGAQTWCSDRGLPVTDCFPQLFPESVE